MRKILKFSTEKERYEGTNRNSVLGYVCVEQTGRHELKLLPNSAAMDATPP